MNKFFILFTVILFSNIVLAQQKFQSGYIIKNNIKIECLIKNEGWIKSPMHIEYKLNEKAEIQIGNPEEIDGFYIEDTKYRFTSKRIQPDPNIASKKRFIQVLVEGKASLYYFSSYVGTLYYMEVDGENLELLHHKTRIEEGKQLETSRFRAQLYNRLKCENLTRKMFQDLRYNGKNLTEIFLKYNACENSDSFDYTQFKNKGKFSGYLLAGMGIYEPGSLERPQPFNINSENRMKWEVGAEIEYILPIASNKLGFIANTFYSTHSKEGRIWYPLIYPQYERNMTFDYDLFQMAIGFRFYSFLGEDHKFFGNVSWMRTTTFNGEAEIFNLMNESYKLENPKFKQGFYPAVSLGYRYKHRFGLELKYTYADILQFEDATITHHFLNAMISYRVF